MRGSEPDGMGRRRALECMAWAGGGVLWTVVGGVPQSALLGGGAQAATLAGGFSFVQISDSHIGFHNPPNPDTPATLTAAIAEVNRTKGNSGLMIHTGDVSHLSADAQFDTAHRIIQGAGLETHFVPGEHDVLIDNGRGFFARFDKAASTGGWYSFDQGGVHFVGLNNVQDLKAGGMGALGMTQLEWLERDLAHRSASQPIVVFAHIPLWVVYEKWGWGTSDGAQALSYLRRFGSVTVLNGHIHQIIQKVEGTISCHTARSTAFPQPAPGSAPAPGPMQVPAARLRSFLGITEVRVVRGQHQLAVTDSTLTA